MGIRGTITLNPLSFCLNCTNNHTTCNKNDTGDAVNGVIKHVFSCVRAALSLRRKFSSVLLSAAAELGRSRDILIFNQHK